MDLTEQLQPVAAERFGEVGTLDRRDAEVVHLQCENCKEKAALFVQWLWMWLQQPAPATAEEREALAASYNPALFEKTQDMLREVEQSMMLLFRQRAAIVEHAASMLGVEERVAQADSSPIVGFINRRNSFGLGASSGTAKKLSARRPPTAGASLALGAGGAAATHSVERLSRVQPALQDWDRAIAAADSSLG
eukprot:96781-Prymnesium_polylepis.1